MASSASTSTGDSPAALPSLGALREIALNDCRLAATPTALQDFALEPLNLPTFLALAVTDPQLRPIIRGVLGLSPSDFRELLLTVEPATVYDSGSHESVLMRDLDGSAAASSSPSERHTPSASGPSVEQLMELTFGAIMDAHPPASAPESDCDDDAWSVPAQHLISRAVSSGLSFFQALQALPPGSGVSRQIWEALRSSIPLQTSHSSRSRAFQESALPEGGDTGDAVAGLGMDGGASGDSGSGNTAPGGLSLEQQRASDEHLWMHHIYSNPE